MLAFALKGTSTANGVSTFLTGFTHQSFFLFALAVMAIVLTITYVCVHQIAAVDALAMVLLLTWATSTR